jgi:dinuclear metal center YbgI/SA1388 family protein
MSFRFRHAKAAFCHPPNGLWEPLVHNFLRYDVCMTERERLTRAFEQLLQPDRFNDYGPNGLQVEGKPLIQKVVSGVTASLALIDAAIAHEADAIFVHHGLFWRGQDGRVTGWMKQRLQKLLAHEINLYAYHLPLDAHPALGNNAQLGKILGFTPLASGEFGHFGVQNLGWLGRTSHANIQALGTHVARSLKRNVTVIEPAASSVNTVAWCTGGAQSSFEDAIAAGADVYITGEISEPQAHVAKEMGCGYIACGHHASERYGAPAVASYVAQMLGIAHEFVDIDNPA